MVISLQKDDVILQNFEISFILAIQRPPRITAIFRSLVASQVRLRDSRLIALLISLGDRA